MDKERVALLIEWDSATGKRAGGINPRDANLRCHGWQDLDSVPPKEIRLITDDRDVKQYEGIVGVTILLGTEAINKAIDENIPNQYRYGVEDETIFKEHLRQKGISLDQYEGQDIQKVLWDLKENKKIIGIRKSSRFEKL